MSVLLILAAVLGAAATALFAAGYWRGIRDTLRDHQRAAAAAPKALPASAMRATPAPAPRADTVGPGYGWKIAAAVAAAALAIGLVGVHPYFIFLGPLLTLASAAGIGLAFFFDRGAD